MSPPHKRGPPDADRQRAGGEEVHADGGLEPDGEGKGQHGGGEQGVAAGQGGQAGWCAWLSQHSPGCVTCCSHGRQQSGSDLCDAIAAICTAGCSARCGVSGQQEGHQEDGHQIEGGPGSGSQAEAVTSGLRPAGVWLVLAVCLRRTGRVELSLDGRLGLIALGRERGKKVSPRLACSTQQVTSQHAVAECLRTSCPRAGHVGLTNAAGCSAHMTMDPPCAGALLTPKQCASVYLSIQSRYWPRLQAAGHCRHPLVVNSCLVAATAH
jgi:hypothetical protein